SQAQQILHAGNHFVLVQWPQNQIVHRPAEIMQRRLISATLSHEQKRQQNRFSSPAQSQQTRPQLLQRTTVDDAEVEVFFGQSIVLRQEHLAHFGEPISQSPPVRLVFDEQKNCFH